jgi:hypothetical protein
VHAERFCGGGLRGGSFDDLRGVRPGYLVVYLGRCVRVVGRRYLD